MRRVDRKGPEPKNEKPDRERKKYKHRQKEKRTNEINEKAKG